MRADARRSSYMKRFSVLCLVLMVISASRVEAQITSYRQDVFAAGVNPSVGSPVTSNTYQASAFTCNQVAPAIPATLTNPTRILFDDPANAGRVCLATLSSTLLSALPNGLGYFSTLVAIDSTGLQSLRSTPTNSFNQQVLPPAPTNVKLL
jgi:hypothetical protein